MDAEHSLDDSGDTSFSCSSFVREAKYLQKEFATAEQPYGWSDVSRKKDDYNVIIVRRFSSRNQYHLSLLRALRAVQVPQLLCSFHILLDCAAPQNVMVRMSVSSGFRKYRTAFAPLSKLAAAINNHPESAMMSIQRVVVSK